MNVASRIAKQIEGSDNLVPKSQSGLRCTPVADFKSWVRPSTVLEPLSFHLWLHQKKSKIVTEPPFEICIKGIKDTINSPILQRFRKEFSAFTWKTQKVKVYQQDFILRQKLDQFTALFNPEETKEKDTKTKTKQELKQAAIKMELGWSLIETEEKCGSNLLENQ